MNNINAIDYFMIIKDLLISKGLVTEADVVFAIKNNVEISSLEMKEEIEEVFMIDLGI